MVLNYDSFWFTVLIATGFVFLIIAIVFTIKIAYSQDIDPAGYCLYKYTYPFNELCAEQKIYELYNQMLERAQEYNDRFK